MRYLFLIVIFAICFYACKSKKDASSKTNANNEEANVKFEKYFIDGCTQFNIGNDTLAMARYAKCLDIKPQEASVNYQMSRVKQRLNDQSAAFHYASKANKLAPGNKFYAYHYAGLLREVGDFNKAANVLNECINSNLTDENLYNQLDGIYEIQKATTERIALWNKLKDNAGLKTRIGLKLIDLYKKNNDFASAHGIYNDLKKGAPNNTRFYIEDAKLYESQKDEANANLNYEKAMAINPNNWDINYALFQFYAKKNEVLKAQDYLKFAFEKSAVSFETELPSCQALLISIKNDSSSCAYGRIAASALINSFPTNAKSLYTAAELFNNCRLYNLSLVNYEKAALADPNLFDAWMGAINAGIGLKQYQKVITLGEKALEYFPNTVMVYQKLASAHNLNKQYDKAYEYAVNGERFIFDDAAKVGLFLQEGISLYYKGEYTDAQKKIEEAIAINQTDAELYDVMGNISYYLNDIPKAVENWQKARNMGSKNNLIEKKIIEKKVYE